MAGRAQHPVQQSYDAQALRGFLTSRWAVALLILLAVAAWILFGPGDSVTGMPSPDPYR